MPRHERVIVVFVASPSDLAQEREKLEEVIDELNLTWSEQFAMRLNLVRWETHAVPGVGIDPQDVINNVIPDDVDLFIGMMWGKYGTPTARAGSGTDEEFEKALARFRKNPESIRIMFYFKDTPLPPSQIDTDQLERVKQFQSSLGPKGTLYWSFTRLDEFEQLIRIHFGRQIQHFYKQPIEPTTQQLSRVVVRAVSDAADDLGLIDYLDMAETNIVSLIEIAGRISKETEMIGQRMAKHADAISAYMTPTRQHITRGKARSLIDRAALDMNIYATRLRGELPLFDQQLNAGVAAVAQIALIKSEVQSNDGLQAKETLELLINLSASIDQAGEGITIFRDSVLDLPKMTSNLNRAGRETATVLQDILNSLDSASSLIAETRLSVNLLTDHE